jgi:hypothetical protein
VFLLKLKDKFTDRDISSEWPRKIVGDKVNFPNKDSYRFKR